MRKKAKDIAIVILMLLVCLIVFCLTSCKTVQPTIHTSESKTVTIRQHDTTLIYKGANVKNAVNFDSIIAYLTSQLALNNRLNGIQTKVIYKDASDKVALTFWLDKFGKLQADCSSKDSMYKATLQEQQTYWESQTKVIHTEVKTEIPNWGKVVFGISIGIILALGTILVFIIKTNK